MAARGSDDGYDISSSETLPAPTSSLGDPPGATGDLESLFEVPAEHYHLGAELARGGMGRILEARDRRAGRRVAIKEIRPELLARYPDAQRKTLLRRFEREARITARLQHPGIVPVYELGRLGDSPFYAMKLLAGEPLDQVIFAAKSPSERLALLPAVLAVAEAIAYAHQQHIIHRDLKPSNVLVGAFGETVVIDWGLAKDLSSDDGDDDRDDDTGPAALATSSGDGLQTVAGTVLGTPHYMPPEQAAGESVDARADVYALGAILYHLLCGEAPYAAKKTTDLEQLLTSVMTGPPASIRARAPEAPADLVSIVDRAMARDPEQRYPDATEMAADLRRFQTGQLVATHDYSTLELIRRWMREHKGIVATAAAFLIVLIAASGFFVRQILDERARTRQQRDRARANERLAIAQRTAAEKIRDRALALAEDRGREELQAGRPLRAAIFLSEAYRAGRHTEIGSLLLGQAMRSVESLIGGLVVDEPLRFAAFRRDGKMVLIGGARGQVTVWRPGGDVILRRSLHPGSVVTGTLSDDGSRMVTVGFEPAHSDYRALLWSTEPARPIADLGLVRSVFAEPRGPGTQVSFGAQHIRPAFSRDGRWLAIAAARGVAVWDTRTGARAHVLGSAWGPRGTVRFLPSGNLCVTGGGAVSVWDPATGRLLRTLRAAGAAAAPAAADVSADGKRVVTAVPGALVLHDLESGALLRRIPLPGTVRSLRVSPDGRFVSLVVSEGRARVLDLNSGKTLHDIDGCTDAMVTRDQHRDRLVVVRRGAISIHDLRTGVETHYIRVGMRGAWATDFTGDGARVIGVQPDRAFVWSTASRGARVYEVAARRDQLAFELSPRGTLLVTRGPRRAWLWRTGTATRLAELPMGRYAFRPDDQRLLIYGDGAWYWDTSKPHRLRTLTTDRIAQGLLNGDGKYVATRDHAGRVRIWSGFHGALLHAVDRSAVEIGFADPSSRLLARHQDGTLSVIVPRTGRVVATLWSPSPIQSFASAGDRVLTLHADGGATLWDAKTGERRFALAHKGPLSSPALHPKGELLAARSADRVIVWSARDGRRLHAIRWAGAPRLLGDGSRLLIGADPTDPGDGPSLWDARTGRLLQDFGSGQSDGMAVLENVAVVPNQRWLTAGHAGALIDVHSGRRLMSIGAATRGTWFPDASRFLLVGASGPEITAIVELPFPREERPPSRVHQLIAARSPWQIIDGRLLPKKIRSQP